MGVLDLSKSRIDKWKKKRDIEGLILGLTRCLIRVTSDPSKTITKITKLLS